MLNFMQVWFGSFLFGGLLIPLRDMYWPFEAFYYFFPFAYFIRSYMYATFADYTFEPCTEAIPGSAVCVPSSDGLEVLRGLSQVFPLLEIKNQIWQDIGIIVGLAMFWKVLTIAAVLVTTRKVASIGEKGMNTTIRSKTGSNRSSVGGGDEEDLTEHV